MTAKITEFKINSGAPDRLKTNRLFWTRLETIGLTAGAVLRHSQLPPTVATGEQLITTAQLFSLWRSIDELANDPAAGWKLVSRAGSAQFAPALMTALHARNFRESLARHARYKQLCSTQEYRFTEKGGEFQIEPSWPFAAGERPPALLIDAVFALILELGRRGTARKIAAKRVELTRKKEGDDGLAGYFGCPVKYRCSRDALVLHVTDVDLPFVTHNEELVAMLAPQFDEQLKAGASQRTIADAVKWVLRRLLSGSRPDVTMVAKELGMSDRTLQRRITEEGQTFRQLLNDTRRELVHEYLGDDSIQIAEAAFLVGFENANSFYRAFRSWEGKTPAEWRAERNRN